MNNFPVCPTGLRIEEAMLKDLKEVSDGEIKVAVSTVYMNLEVRRKRHVMGLFSFAHGVVCCIA